MRDGCDLLSISTSCCVYLLTYLAAFESCNDPSQMKGELVPCTRVQRDVISRQAGLSVLQLQYSSYSTHLPMFATVLYLHINERGWTLFISSPTRSTREGSLWC